MNRLYEDKHMVIAEKRPGVLSQGEGETMETLVGDLVGTRVSAVHRLDAPVGGCMVFAKSKKAAAGLGRAVAEHQLHKVYLAVVMGTLDTLDGTLQDLLYHDPRTNKTFVVDRKRKGVREAILHYHVRGTAQIDGQTCSLVEVCLETGRTHQIRVQFGSRKHPLWGDRRYGGPGEGFGLWAWKLTVPHPINSKEISVESPVPNTLPWSTF